MRDSERYLEQAETVTRMAARAESEAEKEVYLSIAAGWRRLAAEVLRHEGRPANGFGVPAETRSFSRRDRSRKRDEP